MRFRPQIVEHRPDRYLRTPTLVEEDGGATLYAVSWNGHDEALVAFAVNADGGVDDERELERKERIIALTREQARPRISEDPGEGDRASANGWAVRVVRADGQSEVRARTPAGLEVGVWAAYGTAVAPTVVPGEGGAWIAFHHNVREDTGEPDLIKWLALRFVTDTGDVREPDAPMRDRDRDREGEEQNWEFPSLHVAADGALAIFGRGAHAFFRQDVSSEGFGKRAPLGNVGWGCRGRWVSTCAMDEHLLVARRVKEGIALDWLEPPRGGPPPLRAAEVALPRRPHRDVPARPSGPDPAARDGRRTLFGDIHQHSAHSDGVGSAMEPYVRARYVYGDDFCALTDHESFIGKRIGPGEWAYLCAVADSFDDPGHFATLLAYEWTGRRYPGPGHKVVYLPSHGGPIVSRDDVPQGADLVARAKELGGFAVPHHVGWTGADEDAHDPVGQPVWEICSCHGCYLHTDHPLGGRGDLRDQMVESVMRRGKRFGFIACSDGHGLLYHHGVGRKRDPFRCGLTAVQARDCTREAILEAIRERRCYATSGVPILLDLRCGEAGMGAEVEVAGPVTVRAEVRCASPIEALMLIGKEGPLATVSGDGKLDATLAAAVAPGWVYAKVEQVDGEMAWSSPIFLDQSDASGS